MGLALLVQLGCGAWNANLPKDDALVEKFHANEAEFRSLVSYLSTQGGRLLKPEYQNRVKALGVELSMNTSIDPPKIAFRAASNGWALQGTSKGILYSAQPVAPILPSLDDCRLQPHSAGYRTIGPDWYVYLSRD